jgi:hypothetical protein
LGIVGGSLSASLWGQAVAPGYADRLVYVSRTLTQDEHVADIDRITATAAAKGLNGMVLSGGLEGVGRWEPPRLQRLESVKRLCRERGIEIIPIIWSVGYGSGLGQDPNLAVGLPCREVPFVAENGVLRFAADAADVVRNGGFEEVSENRFAGYAFHDRPGEVSFADTTVKHSGATSIRFENYGAFEHGHARFMQEIKVSPYRQYLVRCWVRCEGLQPTSSFRLQVYGGDVCIAPREFALAASTEWKEVTLLFNSGELQSVRLYGGLWGGKAGRIWFDDLSLQPLALVNVLRRPGTPLRLRAADGDTVFAEGRDVEPVRAPRLSFGGALPEAATVRLTAGSRIQPGQRVLIDYYHGMAINQGQVTVCMSEPALYEYWTQSAQALQEKLAPRRWFLSMDEIRGGGTCAACEARGMTMGQILADCIRKQCAIIRAVCPDATLYIWSDMLDPNHNARDHYYLAKSTFAGSWEGIPKDLVIACWYYSVRDKSMAFFAEQGFPTLAGAYYDGDTMENILGWLETCSRTPRCRGIMYTTWQDKYGLLEGFGDAVRQAAPTAAAP